MAKPNIRSLDAMAFTSMTGERERHIEEASTAIPPKASSYKANRMAAALHPSVQHVKIAQVIDRGPRFRSFVLEADEDRGTEGLAWFDAGQYLSVEVPLPEGAVTRPFSICSSPLDAKNGQYQLTLERVPGGRVSDFVWDTWVEGTKLDVSMPCGEFTYEPIRDARQVVALVGGSSITPIYSLAKAVAEGTEHIESLTILYGTNTWDEAVLEAELQELAVSCDAVTLVNVLADEERDGCEHGFITLDLVRKHAPEGDVSYFICGPQAMRLAIDAWIDDLGVRRKFIRREVFGEYRDPEKDPGYPAPAATEFKLTVRVCGEEHELTCNAHDTLLNWMERQGIHAPARCRSGECGWCHSRLVSGDVYVPERTDGRREADKKYGYVHPCATFPLSDVVLEVPPFAN